MSDEAVLEKLKGEGDTRTEVRVRRECDYCEEFATRKRTFLLSGTRGNPASSAYGKDDCSWCEDAHEFLCHICRGEIPDGYVECSTFNLMNRNGQRIDNFAHMFLRWEPVTP